MGTPTHQNSRPTTRQGPRHNDIVRVRTGKTDWVVIRAYPDHVYAASRGGMHRGFGHESLTVVGHVDPQTRVITYENGGIGQWSGVELEEFEFHSGGAIDRDGQPVRFHDAYYETVLRWPGPVLNPNAKHGLRSPSLVTLTAVRETKTGQIVIEVAASGRRDKHDPNGQAASLDKPAVLELISALSRIVQHL